MQSPAGVAGSDIKERTAWCVEMGLVPSTDKAFRFKTDGVPPEDLLLLLGAYPYVTCDIGRDAAVYQHLAPHPAFTHACEGL